MSSKTSESIKEVDVSPDMQFYRLLESYPYTLQGALSEYIDNALEAFRIEKTNQLSGMKDILLITISINASSITISDNGVGISKLDIQRAMKPAYRPPSQSLSEFGIGMKAASMWLGKTWEMESCPLTEGGSFKIKFDLEKLLKSEQKTVKLQPLKHSEPTTGVKITVKNLIHQIDKEQAEWAWEELQETYQLFTSREDPKPILKLVFKYEGQALSEKKLLDFSMETNVLKFPKCKFKKPILYTIGEDRIWKKNISFMFEDKEVRGFILVKKVSSQTLNPGIRLFRYGRLIKGTEREQYRPPYVVGTANKHAPSRFYAELHLDGQSVSNSKGKLNYDENLFLRTLKNHPDINEFVEQAENYRANLAKTNQVTKFNTIEGFHTITGSKPKATQLNPLTLRTPRNNGNQKGQNRPPAIVEAPNYIDFSQEVFNGLGRLKYKKLPIFYASLCRISLKDEPILAYVGAWSFFESLGRALGQQNGADFPSFFNNYVINKNFPNKEEAKPFKHALAEIASKGNLNKHAPNYASLNAQQLASDFELLEVILQMALNENKQ